MVEVDLLMAPLFADPSLGPLGGVKDEDYHQVG